MKSEYIFTMAMEKDKRLPLYIGGIGCEEYQNHILRREGLPLYQLAICIDGAGKFLIDGKEYLVESGMSFYFRPDIPHEYYPIKEPWTTLWIIFAGFGVDALLKAFNFGAYEVFATCNIEEAIVWYNKLFKVLSAKKNNSLLEASGIFYNFFVNIGCHSMTQNSDRLSRINDRLNKVINYIKANYQKDISLNDLAEVAGVTTSYLCRLFKQAYNTTPFTYILQFRICAAKEALINFPDKSIKSIVYESGFADCSYFGAVFKEFEGCSPNQFRLLYTKSE